MIQCRFQKAPQLKGTRNCDKWLWRQLLMMRAAIVEKFCEWSRKRISSSFEATGFLSEINADNMIDPSHSYGSFYTHLVSTFPIPSVSDNYLSGVLSAHLQHQYLLHPTPCPLPRNHHHHLYLHYRLKASKYKKVHKTSSKC